MVQTPASKSIPSHVARRTLPDRAVGRRPRVRNDGLLPARAPARGRRTLRPATRRPAYRTLGTGDEARRHRLEGGRRGGCATSGGVAGAAGRPCRGCPAGSCGPVPNDRLRHTLIGYARVSKADGSQSLDLQRDALQAAGVDAGHVYHDVASGVRDDRPCVRTLRTGDVLVVWKLDRLGRTLAHLVNTVQDLSTRGVGLRVFTGQGAQIDTALLHESELAPIHATTPRPARPAPWSCQPVRRRRAGRGGRGEAISVRTESPRSPEQPRHERFS